MIPNLSSRAQKVWAKTGPLEEGTLQWLPLWCHHADAAAVAGRLWDEWLPTSVIKLITPHFNNDNNQARTVTTWLSSVHDIGKCSPAFAIQVPELADAMRKAGFTLPLQLEGRQEARHALVGHALLTRWLETTQGWSRQASEALSVVVGGHHGVPPEYSELNRVLNRIDLVGTDIWRETQDEMLIASAELTGAIKFLQPWSSLHIPKNVQALLTGLVIVSDWISSSQTLFPLVPVGQQPTDFDRIAIAWPKLHIPLPWKAVVDNTSVSAQLHTKFSLPISATARPIQEAAYAVATSAPQPKMLIIEAPMGEGKTEAALLAAEVLAARTGSGGIFVALPTQATTDSMFERVVHWLSTVPDARLADSASAIIGSLHLAHGKASLNTTFRELRYGSAKSVGVDETSSTTNHVGLQVNWWLTGRKKGPLADFVVGTVDQLLFSGLKARHVVLRHLGVSRKVVILDEVHAYDAYMSTYLHRVLEWLGAYGVPTILLSATLPKSSKVALLEAYTKGQNSLVLTERAGVSRRRVTISRPNLLENNTILAYPSITALSQKISTQEVPQSTRKSVVTIELMEDSDEELVRKLKTELAQGGCALVVRNTVSRAQSVAKLLAQHFPNEVRLVHSRFISQDRMENDEWLRTVFGSSSAYRPQKFIVVGTQVVEQSLDIDFDIVVTDLCPVDLLLQRIGRLHRHDGHARPSCLSKPKCIITGVSGWYDTVPDPIRGSKHVYDEYLLLATAWALICSVQHKTIHLPEDIPTLVDLVYESEIEPPNSSWKNALVTAKLKMDSSTKKREIAAQAYRIPSPGWGSLVGWLSGLGSEPKDDSVVAQATVRDARPSIEVLMAMEDSPGQIRIPDWVTNGPGNLIPTEKDPDQLSSDLLASCSIRLPEYLGSGKVGTAVLALLEKTYFPAWQKNPQLQGQLLLLLTKDRTAILGDFKLTYSPETGLEVTKT